MCQCKESQKHESPKRRPRIDVTSLRKYRVVEMRYGKHYFSAHGKKKTEVRRKPLHLLCAFSLIFCVAVVYIVVVCQVFFYNKECRENLVAVFVCSHMFYNCVSRGITPFEGHALYSVHYVCGFPFVMPLLAAVRLQFSGHMGYFYLLFV